MDRIVCAFIIAAVIVALVAIYRGIFKGDRDIW